MLSTQVKCAIQILSEIEKAAAEGNRLSVTDLRNRCGIDKQLALRTTQQLRCKRWVADIGRKQVLIKELDSATLHELVTDIDGGISLGWIALSENSADGFMNCGLPAVGIERWLQEEMEERLRGIRLCELFPCGNHPLDKNVMRRVNRSQVFLNPDKRRINY